MLLLRKPSPSIIRDFLTTHAKLGLTYTAAGASVNVLPPGYDVDQTRIKLGEGEQVFAAAQAAIEGWDHFRLGWVETCPADTPIKVGQVVAVLVRILGLWWLNACRIVYVVDEDELVRRFGFAYGTLPDNAENGENLFLIEWDRANETVWYEILAFSRPRHFLAGLGYLWVRLVQKQFGRESAAAMVRAVAKAAVLPPSDKHGK